MSPYGKNTMSECKKCGSKNINTKFIAKDEHITSSAREKSTSEFIWSSESTYYWSWRAEKEHLRFNCGCCGNEWLGKCMDDG